MHAVTTFSANGWTKYAREGVESFVRHWPGRLHCYYEQTAPEIDGMLLNATNTGKLVWHDLLAQQALRNVLGWMARIPMMQGRTPDGAYNYHRDAWKFCRKTFAVQDAASRCSGLLFWLDADVRLTQDVPEQVLGEMLAKHAVAYLGRKESPHSECGFIGFNLDVDGTRDFINRWAGSYVDGSFGDLPGWHDCWVFDALREQTGIRSLNLTELTSTGGVAERVFEKSVMGQYGTHLKGSAKHKEAA